MGDLPNDVRTALIQSGSKETQLLASLLLSKKLAGFPYNVDSSK